MVESRRKFVVDFFISSLPKIINKSKGIILIPVVTKILGQDAYGIWTNFAVGLTLIASIASLSLGAATNKFLVNAPDRQLREDYWAIMTVTTILSLIIGGTLILFQDIVATFTFGGSARSGLVLLLAAVLVFSLYTRQSVQFYRSQRQMGMFAGIQSLKSVGEIIVIIFAAVVFKSITAILLSFLSFHIVLSLGIGASIIRDFGVGTPNFSRISQYIRFGVPLTVTGIMYWIVNVSDRYLITYYHTIDVTGGYAIVYATASGLTIFSMAIGTVLFPDLSELRNENDTEEYRHRLNTIIEYFFIFSIPATIGLVVVSNPLLQLLSSSEIREYTHLMAILAPAMVAYGLFNIFIQSLLADGWSRASAIVWAGIATLNLIANLILVPTYAASGAAIATFGSFLLGLGIVVVWKRDDIIFSSYLFGKIVFSSVLMGTIVLWIQSQLALANIILLPVSLGIGAAIYLLSGYLLGFITKEDVKFAREFIV